MLEILILILFMVNLFIAIIFDISIVLALFLNLILLIIYAFIKDYKLKEIFHMVYEGLLDTKTILFVFMLIGMITGIWRLSGTIAYKSWNCFHFWYNFHVNFYRHELQSLYHWWGNFVWLLFWRQVISNVNISPIGCNSYQD